jgi:hypothetical protein
MTIPDSIPNETEVMHWQARVQLGGGLYRGVQKGDPSIGLEPVVLFDDPKAPKAQRSTMGVKASELSAAAVMLAIQKQRDTFAQFERYAEKAATRVFQQFSRRQHAR